MRTGRWIVAALGALLAFGTADLGAQSIVVGSIEGQVVDMDGVGLRGAALTLTEERTGVRREAIAGRDGAFGFSFVVSGDYSLRAEVLGFRPRLVTGVPLGPGETLKVLVRLPPEAPPVTSIDTVSWGSSDFGSAWPGLGRRVSSADLASLPDVRFGLAPFAELNSQMDPLGGFQGRPAHESVIFSEGEAFRPARHPAGVGNTVLALPFPRSGVSGLDVLQGLSDIEWSGSGAAIPVRTRPGADQGRGSAYGLFSGGSMWNAADVTDPPSVASFWGGADASLTLIPDTSVLSLAVEGGRVQSVQTPSAADSVLGQLLAEGEQGVGTGLRELLLASAMARLDWGMSDGGQVTARGGFASFDRTIDRGQGPGVGYGVASPASGTDGSISTVLTTPLTDALNLEVRGSLGFSSRDYDPLSDLPGAWLVGARTRLGPDPSLPGHVSRFDVGGGPLLHVRIGPHRLKFGIRADYSSHKIEYAEGRIGSYAFGSASDLLAGQGTFTRTLGATPKADFSTVQFSVFAQYRWAAAPGLDLTSGIRYSRQKLPTGDVRPVTEWIDLTGVRNDSVPRKLDKVDARFHILWDVQQDSRTWVVGGLGVQNGMADVGALAEWLLQDGGLRVQRGFGAVGNWPSMPDSSSAPFVGTRLTLMGPEFRAPLTLRASGALIRQIGAGVSLGASASFRRTENLLRRSDLNRPAVPTGDDQTGRPLFGDLGIRGGVLAADPATNRRFEEFEAAWSLDPDGWSEYVGFSVFLNAALRGGSRFAVDYTYSETTDNLVGALQGRAEAGLIPDLGIENWDEGVSDFDIPHRLTMTASLALPGGGALSGVYRYRSGLPFTPMVAAGLDANGDGSAFNDPAFIPAGSALGEVGADWGCVGTAQGAFAVRNSCRGDPTHRIDLRLSFGLGRLPAQIVVDALNVTDVNEGVRDNALLVIDPTRALTRSGNTVTVPYEVNPGFGAFLLRTDPGRMIRVGIRIGGGS